MLTCMILMVCLTTGYPQSDVGAAVVEYTNKKMGKKVKRGECWDLVAEALNYANADWSPPGGFGTKLNIDSDQIRPGDIIEFRKVKIETPDRQILQAPQHYGVIMEVLGTKKFTVGHQNFNNKKKVLLTDFDLNYMKKGRVTIYRPG